MLLSQSQVGAEGTKPIRDTENQGGRGVGEVKADFGFLLACDLVAILPHLHATTILYAS